MAWKKYADTQGAHAPSKALYEAGVVPINYSAWPLEQPATQYAALSADIDADVVVIGAGLAGSSVALHLAERGIKTVLLEADQPGAGASGRNAGHIQPYLSSLEPLSAHKDGGRKFVDYFTSHRNIIVDLCAKHGIEADVHQRGMIDAAKKPSADLEKKAKLWQSHGYNIDIIGADTLKNMLGTEVYHYGLLWREGGQVNPYLFTNGMVSAAVKLGAQVYADSRVVACEAAGSNWRVRTATGSVTAAQVVICTSGHTGNDFFPELQHTQYPLVACGLATRPLSAELLAAINPSRSVFTQYPAGLYPIVIDERNRLVSATIPGMGSAQQADKYFAYFLRYLHRTFPATRNANITMESYWTGMTANSSHHYDKCYPKLYQVAKGVHGLMNFGSWGNLQGPMMGMSLAHAIADGRLDDCVLPIEKPVAVRFPGLFETKIRRTLIPIARLADRFDLT
ncbi:MAG: FAD-binding oxidoreductase [Pseudomonas sp.]|nr:FAD-binding oxidoreductase [Pseudomonas sp.]MDD2222036.1 FAD-dependent oxidoreductase [Pseudomonas sp.]MDY0414861.1 FAD-dependent oxidoreductase [Pseudomonas sp.]